MRWQKVARLAIAAIVIAFTGVVYVALRKPGPPAAGPSATDATPRPEGSAIFKGIVDTNYTDPDGNLVFRLQAEDQVVYPDGRNVFQKATLTLPDRQGRTVQIFGNEMDVTPGESGPMASARVTNNVKLTTSDGLTVTANEATYDGKTTVLTVPGDVKFVKERLTGTGVGATYDQTRNVLWLLDRAKIVVTPDEKGAGALDASATSAGLARADHYIRLNGNAHVIGEGRELKAQELTVQLSPDDRLIQNMSLRGQSSLTGAPGAGAAPAMSANDIDLTYGPDGRAIQHARLMENAVAQLAGAEGGKRIAGRTIEMTMAPEGGTVTALTATEKVQVDLPAAEGIPARRITAATLTSGGPNGLQTATFTGGVDYREMRPGARGAAPSERTGRSLQLVVETEPGLGAIQVADFRGHVRIVDGATTAEGQRAIYRVATDTFDIAPSPGDPGPPPTVNDGRVLVNARTIAFTAANRKLLADTDVRSSLQPASKSAAKPAAGGRGKPAPAPAREGGKVPAILKQDQPVIVTSNRLEYDGAAGTANYTGNAKLFQDRTSIYGDAILIDDRTANLTATGHVRSVMFFQETDAKTKKPQLVQTDAAGHMLVYEDAKRLATYTTGPTARAHIIGTQGDVTAEQIQLFLKEGGNELERAEADKNVTVKEGFRTSTGHHLTYTPADETYVMRGTPVEVVEKTPTDCRIALGTVLRFLRTSVDMRIDGNGIAPVTMTPCPPGKAPSL